MPVEVVIEYAKQRLERQPRQSVIATGDIGTQVAGFLQKNCSGQRQHEQSQAAVTQQEPTGDEADQSRSDGGREKSADWFRPVEPCRGKPDGVGADAEECRMPERDDPGIAEDQVKRECKHHHHQHLAAEGHARGEYEEDGDGDQPWQCLGQAEAMPLGQIIRRAFARGSANGLTRGHRTPQAL